MLAHYADDMGLMSVALAPGTYDVTLRYLPGPAERAGAWISLAVAGLWLAIWIYSLSIGPPTDQDIARSHK